MSVWDWILEYQSRMESEGDTMRAGLFKPFEEARAVSKTDIDGGIQILRQARQLAEQLNEPWWVAFYDHWIAQYLLHEKEDYPAALALAVHTAVEVRQPIYHQLPQRICLYEDLIRAYLNMDPTGYAENIQQAIDYMQAEVSPDAECRFCLQSIRINFAMKQNRWEKAEQFSAALLNMTDAERSPHYKVSAREWSCKAASKKHKWHKLQALATEGLILAQKNNEPETEITFLAWQAVAEYQLGKRREAARLYRQALAMKTRTVAKPDNEPLYLYLEAIGELDSALKFRERVLQDAIASGSPYFECDNRLEICKLRAKMGILTEDDLAQARTAAQKLRLPGSFLKELAEVGQPNA